MTLESALITAIGTLVSVILAMAGVIVYLWKEVRSQYRLRAKDSSLFLHTLETLQRRYSERAPGHSDRATPSDPPRPNPHTLAGFYSTRGPTTNRTRG
jgi:hypothetical protein